MKPDINVHNIHALLSTSQYLGIQSIVNQCEHFINSNVDDLPITAVFQLFSVASAVKSLLCRYIVERFIRFVRHDTFLQIPYNDLNTLMKDYRSFTVPYKSENFLLDALIRWMNYSRQERKEHFKDYSK